MSEQNFIPPSSDQPFGTHAAAEQPVIIENVAKGLFFALGAVLGGIILTVVVWRIGFIASITSYVLAAGAIYLYDKGAGTVPKRGLIPILLLVVAGVVVAFFGIVASDAWDVYDKFGASTGDDRISFILNNIFRGEVLRGYGKDIAMFGVFAVLGIYSTLRRLMASVR